MEAHCGVAVGVPSADGRLVLGREECLGACATAPVMLVDGAYHGSLDIETARQLLDGLE
jgi:NADH-quinone oxidoreductase subunit E